MHSPSEVSSLSGDEVSDLEDVFAKVTPGTDALDTTYGRWHNAVNDLTALLRDDVLLPLDPHLRDDSTCFSAVDTGIFLPLWHCPFKGCAACSKSYEKIASHEKSWWRHVWSTTGHQGTVLAVIKAAGIHATPQELPEVGFALIVGALAESQRRNPFGVPRVGTSTDRRSLCHLGEVFKEDNVKTLMCFICGCKHIFHAGYDKFGEAVTKGDITYRKDVKKILTKVLHGDDDYSRAWEYNMSGKRFKERFGEAVRSDDSFANATWEWRRLVERKGKLEEAMCNPEDVIIGRRCNHDGTRICSRCEIPICNECWRYSVRNEKIPKA